MEAVTTGDTGSGKRRKALVFLDYDMLVRHFVLAGAFAELERRYHVRYVFHAVSTSPKKGLHVDPATLGLGDWTSFEIPRVRMGSWDKIYCITALHNQRNTKNFAYRRQIMADIRGWPRTYWYQLLATPPLFGLIRRKLLGEMGVYDPLARFIAAEKPDIVVHPSILAGYFVNELTQICPARGIPLVLLMNSWDNPSTKAMNTGLPDRLVVWGPQTRRHAIDYMKMPPDRVLEFGAPQFAVYRDPIAEDDAALRAMFRAPPEVPVILYAGVSKSVDETAHLEALDRAIAAAEIPPCHVIYRPHPWRGGLVAGEKNFFDMPFRHVTMDPHMEGYYRRVADRPEQGFDMADYRATARLLRLVRGIISPLSTMLLEAVMHGLPVIMFWPDGPKTTVGQTIELGMKLPHFAEFWGPEGIQICTEGAALAPACRRMLVEHQTPAVSAALAAHARGYVVLDGPSYATRLADLADELVAKRAA